MEFGDLEAFVLVSETKSVNVAAARLNLSQSAVTRRLQSLEGAVGAVLIHREARPLALTPEGAEAYKHAKMVLTAMDDMRLALESDISMSGMFRLGMSMSLGDSMLAYPVACLRQEFSNLQVHIVVEDSPLLIKRVEKRELDAVVVFLTDEKQIPEGLKGDFLTQEPLGVVAARSLAMENDTSLKKLMDYPWALNPPGCAARDELMRTANSLRLSPRVMIESSSAELKFSLIERGIALGLSRPSSIAASRYASQLHMIVPPEFVRNVGMWLVYPESVGRLKAPLHCLRRAVRDH